MTQAIAQRDFDVVVLGGGSAGVASAIAAARNGARTVLVDAGPMIGGEMLSGIPIDGCLSSRGEWVVGGISRELFAECERMGGYIGPINDYRSLHVVAIDPEVMKLAVVNLVHMAGVTLLLYTFAETVVAENGTVKGVVVLNKNRRTLITGKVIIDCTGDGDAAVDAGAPWEIGDAATGNLQPVTMVYRMQGVETKRLLEFVRAHPEHFGLAEYKDRGMSIQEAAEGLYKQGLPKVFLVANGPLMKQAIADGEMYQSSMIAVTPISLARKEVSINSTRIGNLDATQTSDLSRALPDLLDQVWLGVNFMRKYVPGFENAVFSGIAPRIGIRETRRIVGEYMLTKDDVMQARKRDDGIGKGAHELDVHGSGVKHVRSTIKDEGSYDIPYACLVPKNVKNMLVAGRCFSSTREAHSSARVMGTCMAMGQAAGTAAAWCAGEAQWNGDVRAVDVGRLRSTLRAQGAVLDGTY
jgi:hypothetical protein